MTYETVIGLEVHVQLRTGTKMFCGCSAEFGAPPNTHVCPVCLGLPGALPVPNGRAVELAVRAALALGCRVHPRCEFVRKNYFYPDLPKGYQITQYAHPLATGGEVVLGAGGGPRRIRLRRLHLEEDAGKSVHDRFPGATAVDLNRAGVPLVEIVTEPEIRSPGEARACLTRLKQLLEHYAAVSDCNMEEGSLRVDANLSVRRVESREAGTVTEVKNLNSFAFVEKALAYERDRHIRLLEEGRKVKRETRLFDPEAGETRGLRGKEEAYDYRYFPDPDLVPLEVTPELVERERGALGELPQELERRLVMEYGLPERDAVQLAAEPRRAAYFEAVVGDRGPAFAKLAANFIMGELAAERKRRDEAVTEGELLPPERLRRAVELRMEGVLSSDTASRALELLMAGEGGEDVDALVEARGLAQIADRERIVAWVEEAVAAHPDEAARYAGGEEKLLGFFMGRVMEAAGGRADPTVARDLLRAHLAAVQRGVAGRGEEAGGRGAPGGEAAGETPRTEAAGGEAEGP